MKVMLTVFSITKDCPLLVSYKKTIYNKIVLHSLFARRYMKQKSEFKSSGSLEIVHNNTPVHTGHVVQLFLAKQDTPVVP